jgi:hypothetical protein
MKTSNNEHSYFAETYFGIIIEKLYDTKEYLHSEEFGIEEFFYRNDEITILWKDLENYSKHHETVSSALKEFALADCVIRHQLKSSAMHSTSIEIKGRLS